MNTKLEHNMIVKLNEKDHEIANKLAKQQGNPSRFKQVYLNTLSVLSVTKLLSDIGYTVNFKESDSFTATQILEDTGHLKIADIGVNLECRPILPKQTEIFLPEEVTNNRDFYIGVQFQESLSEVKLLGFCSASALIKTSEYFATIPLEKLISIDELMDELFDIERDITLIRKDNYLKSKIPDNISLSAIVRQFRKIFESQKSLAEQHQACRDILYSQSQSNLDLLKETDNFNASQISKKEEIDQIAIELFNILEKHWQSEKIPEQTPPINLRKVIDALCCRKTNELINDNSTLNQITDEEFGIGWLPAKIIVITKPKIFNQEKNHNLRKIEGKHNQSIEKERSIYLEENNFATFIMTLIREDNNQIKINVKLKCFDQEFLPSNVKLKLMSEQIKFVRQVTSCSKDKYIRLLPLKCVRELQSFVVEISLNSISFEQQFIIE